MKIRILFTLCLASVVMTACEDQLDRYPKDSFVPENYFHNETECNLFTQNFYTLLPAATSLYEERSDVIAQRTLMSEMNDGRSVSETDSNWNFDKLRDINTFLRYSSNCADLAVRHKYEGVARFFRAWFYFDLIRRFGDVPWVDQPLSSDSQELYKGRDDRAYVVDKLIEDLDFAAQYLDTGHDTYRVTRWAALALKSRICLFEGTWHKYHNLDDGAAYLEASERAALEVIRSGGYALYTAGTTPYLDLFASLTAKADEVILARCYTSGTKTVLTHDVNGYLTGSNAKPGVLKNIVNMYLLKNGKPFTSQPGYATMELSAECVGRDARLAQTIRTPGYKRIGSSESAAPNLGYTMTGYQPVKFLTAAKYDSYQLSENDMPLIRLAEVYLNYAEAKAELGTLTQDDIDQTINLLRRRGGVADLNLAAANAAPDPYLCAAATGYIHVEGENKGVVLEIRRERTVELLMEGFRYWDILRWHEGQRFLNAFEGIYLPGIGTYDLDGGGAPDLCVYVGTKPTAQDGVTYLELNKDIFLSSSDEGNVVVHTEGRAWNEERDYLYPIPTYDRKLTSGAITQNPNWNDGLSF